MSKKSVEQLYAQYSKELKTNADKFALIWEERNKILEIYNNVSEEDFKVFSKLMQKNLAEMNQTAKKIELISIKIQQLRDTIC